MWFKILYVIYLTLALLYPGAFAIGPLSARLVVMLVMLVICIIKGVKWDKYLTLYTIFLFFFGLSSVLTGFEAEFVIKLFGTYLQVYVFYFATHILIKHYDGEKWLLCVCLVIGILDAIVTIGQFYNMGFVDRIINIMGFNYEEDFLSKLNRFDTMEGFTLPGLVGNVRNGYFLSAIAVLVLYNNKNRLTLYNLLLWFLVMVASLLSQERTGFFVAIIMSFFVFFMYITRKRKNLGWFVAFVLVMAAMVFVPKGLGLLQSGNLRFSQGLDIGVERGDLAIIGMDFVFGNPMGGFYEFEALGYPYPHNVFVNMFLVGGVFGGIAIMILFFNQIIYLTKYLIGTIKKHSFSLTTFFGLVFLVYTMNSLTHNASMVYGTFEFFIFWSAFETMEFKEINYSGLIKK